ncbi:RNA polymerase sigma factor CnrH [Clavibacter michiganensis subsp. michiganensis]|uniref:RNA polymerase sigma factor CnrH n=1 Tax=Clavibacter michiganensis subsp. michiganensis TaxID=33013 RepID=A0A251XPX5_CLAMM|nr:RNA polymerase sigma factor CnrH [Clavibacter michiganensis subsp. michiganensis]OUD98716.1 RNA polymerase sigma factor CnrH [Clavibacter michiganensis subsp. michiganensis]OUE05108.1 RNA polymerase sigma factor CnrH [Clavibacter michiganensis subsp. michiganensis]
MALSSSLQDAGDGILAERAADGDARAFEVLVRRHAPYMRAFAIRLTGSRADADDAVQEALITAWDRLPTLEKPDRVKSWLLQIVSRKSIDRIRARRPADDIDDHEIADRLTSPERDAETSSQMRALAAVLDALPASSARCGCCARWEASRTRRSPRSWARRPRPCAAGCPGPAPP